MAEETYPLKFPLRQVYSGAHGATCERFIETVSIREATGKDLLLADRFQGRAVALSLAMIAALSGLTPAQVRKLHAADLEALQSLIMPSLRSVLVVRIDAG